MRLQQALFRFKGPLLSGDVTPGYSGSTEERIVAVAPRTFPDVKVFYLVRDPVTRLWSQISMAEPPGEIRPRELLKKRRRNSASSWKTYDLFQKVGFPARTAERWDRLAPNVRFQHFFFDDIAAQPHETRKQLLEYLGGDPDKPSGEINPARPTARARPKSSPLSDDIKAEIADFFKEELRAAAARFGGHAATWPSLIRFVSSRCTSLRRSRFSTYRRPVRPSCRTS